MEAEADRKPPNADSSAKADRKSLNIDAVRVASESESQSSGFGLALESVASVAVVLVVVDMSMLRRLQGPLRTALLFLVQEWQLPEVRVVLAKGN